MVRKAIYIGIPYSIGFLTAYCLYGTQYVYLSVLVSLMVFGLLVYVFKLGVKQSILCETSFVVGMLIFSNYMVTHVDCLEPYEDQTVDFTGKVVQLTDYTDTSSYTLDGYLDRQHVRVSLYTNTLDCRYGDEISLTATLTAIGSDYLFDSKQYYNSKGVYLQVDDYSNLEVTHIDGNVLYNAIRGLQSYRDRVSSTFKLNMSRSGSALLISMLFGDKSDLSKDSKDSLLRSGLGSLIAVSGFHLAILNSLFEYVFRFLEEREFPVHRVVKFLVHELFMLLFVTVVGFPISAVRTLIMLSIANVGTLIFRQSDTLNTISIVSLLMLTVEPYLIGNVSFLLSIVGVYGIGVLSPYLTKGLQVPHYLKGVLSVGITTACTIPVCVCYFNEASILAPISNLVCVPLCEVALIGGFVVFILGGKTFIVTKAILFVVDLLCKAMLSICGELSKLPFGNIPTGYRVLPYVTIMCVVICLVSYGIFKRVKPLAITIATSILLTLVSLNLVTLYEGNTFKVATMGTSTYRVMVISYQGDINVVDFSKNYKTSTYVQKYLKQFGYSNVSSVTFLKKAYQSMVMYNTQLKDYSTENANVPQGTYLEDGYTILGVSPTQIDFENSKLVYYYGDYSITVYTSGDFEIAYNNMAETFNAQEANTILEYYNYGNFKVKELK